MDELESRIDTLERAYTVILESVEKIYAGMIQTDALLLKSLQAQRRVTELLASLAATRPESEGWQ